MSVFDSFHEEYDAWFTKNEAAYLSELACVRSLMVDDSSPCVEIGVGSGRFAAPLGIRVGVEPSPVMADYARRRGIDVHEACAEELPFADAAFSCVLMVTTICFVDDLDQSLREIRRILVPGGHVLLGYVDLASPLGREYEQKKRKSKFYKEAVFYSSRQLQESLARHGFGDFAFAQTLFTHPKKLRDEDVVRKGFGEGGFVCLRAQTPAHESS